MAHKQGGRRRGRVVGRIIFYAGVLVALFFLLRWFARSNTYPVPSQKVPAAAPAPIETVTFETASGTVIGWQSEPAAAGNDTPLLVYFHGNGENLTTMLASGFFQLANKRQIGVLAIDYPGYGRSDGSPGEAAIIEAGIAAVRHASTANPERPLLIGGWSLGAAVAIRASADADIDHRGLVLISPWTSLGDVARTHFPDWMVRIALKERYDSIGTAERVAAPTVVIHGVADQVIPIAQAYQIADALPRAAFAPIPFAGHNDVLGSDFTWGRIVGFLGEIGIEMPEP